MEDLKIMVPDLEAERDYYVILRNNWAGVHRLMLMVFP